MIKDQLLDLIGFVFKLNYLQVKKFFAILKTSQEIEGEKTVQGFLPPGFNSVKNEDLKNELKIRSDLNDKAEVN